MTYLLDINVLLAITDPMHVHYGVTREWFLETGRRGWATCPITENGYVRIASHPNYPNRPGDAQAVLAMLRRLCAAPNHQFWTDDASIRDMLNTESVILHSQITDAYLLGLAVSKGGKLATLDRGIPTQIVENGHAAIEILTG
jgi:toxin-antitoxin system PIN domain toxin